MARHISLRNHQLSISHLGFGVASLILCALTLFMCASHSHRRWRRWRSCYGYGSHDPVIQLNHEEIMDYQLEGDVEPSGEGSLWKKNIMMGGKCQLPDFSGVIIYDSTGTVVTPAINQTALPALTWR
ncbi:uncharacterized protein LOC130994904 [Salvia miltiorrhiza]|uniref:uncharacterized protein LOC130994904 n=1 Tax=Salvia miltiorrhiza TaxID=226208 RepID=UPI0025AD0508|nr:uncharacterized protein LOC130994904 [Salvia miltiorrhiza]